MALRLDHRFEATEGAALALEPLAPRGRGGPLLGMPEQPPLDLGLAFGEHPAALEPTGHPDLELLPAGHQGQPAGHQLTPRRRRRLELGKCGEQPLPLRPDRGQPLLCVQAGLAGGGQLVGQSALVLGRALGIGIDRGAGRGMPVELTVRHGQGVPGAGERRPAAGQLVPRPVGRRGRIGGAMLGILDGGRGDHAGRRAHPPPGGGEAVALGGHDDEVVALERQLNGLLPSVHPDGAPDEGVEHRLGDRLAVAGPHVAAQRLGRRARRQVDARGGLPTAPEAGVRTGPRGEHRTGHPPLAQRRQGLMGRPWPVHHHRGDTGARRRLERRLPAVVDLDEVE